jgi:hypothetical protein
MKLAFLTLLSLSTFTLAAEPVALINGKDLSNWDFKTKPGKNLWTVGEPKLDSANPKLLTVTGAGTAIVNVAANHKESVDIFSKQKFGSCRIELEVMVPKGSNSGIYVMGEFEVQVYDSFGHTQIKASDMGAIYGASPPPVNASKPPGEWQKYVIEWQAPKFDAEGKKTANGKFLKVELNGQILHKDLEMPGPTPSGVTGKEAAEGPIMFQGDHGPVAYRNIMITPL